MRKVKRNLLLSFIMLTALAFIVCLMYSGTLTIWNLDAPARDAITITYGCCIIMAWMCIALESSSNSTKTREL